MPEVKICLDCQYCVAVDEDFGCTAEYSICPVTGRKICLPCKKARESCKGLLWKPRSRTLIEKMFGLRKDLNKDLGGQS